jgi:peptide chain release factor 2
MRERHDALEGRMAQPDFWLDQNKAKDVVGDLKAVKAKLLPLEKIVSGIEDMEVLLEFAEEDESAEADLAATAGDLGKLVDKFEFQQMLSGPDDACNAYVTVHAGAGGTESCDWAEMLLRMYLRWSERNGYKATIVEASPGEEAGLRRATIHVVGPHAFGYLKAEIGVHRLVRISPFDSAKRRHTSFASLDVSPELEDEGEIEIDPGEIRIDTYRAGGAGGQHVNKTDSAVRITHIPTGLVAQCQQDRSQHKNKRTAMKMLQAKLHALREAKKEKALADAYDAKGAIAFGYQIRSYVMQPYQMVKDLRTSVETGNVEGVLDGDIDKFIEAYLRHMMGGAKG